MWHILHIITLLLPFSCPVVSSSFVTPWIGFPRQEYWSELSFPSSKVSFRPRNWTYVSCPQHPTPALLPGKSHGWRSLVGDSPWGRTESDTTEQLRFHFSLSCIGEGNGNTLQCSCLENPRDGEAWWAAVYGVAQSRTRLKWLSSSSSSCPHRLHCRQSLYCWTTEEALHNYIWHWGFPFGSAGKESACNVGNLVRSLGWRKRLPTLVFCPGVFHGLYSPWDCRVGHDWLTHTFSFIIYKSYYLVMYIVCMYIHFHVYVYIYTKFQ